MPEKYHIETSPVPPRRPRIGKFGVVDWREDCCRCHNCVKKACIYDRYRAEAEYVRNLDDVDALFFDCMGCFSCVQDCTKGLLCMSVNPAYTRLGNSYWTPEIIRTTWLQAETAKVPVSGAGYRGKFTGKGFDSMWTDMSEIVRPTRDGIHGREYISTSVDIGRKPGHLEFDGKKLITSNPPLLEIPFPLIIDMEPGDYPVAKLESYITETARKTGLIALIDSAKLDELGELDDATMKHIGLHIAEGGSMPSDEIIGQVRLVELADSEDVLKKMDFIKKINPDAIVSIRVVLDDKGVGRAIELGRGGKVELIHVAADVNGSQIGTDEPVFIIDMIREIHTTLIEDGIWDQVTIMAGGGIALAEHVAKAILCGADLVSSYLPLLIGVECRMCKKCVVGKPCPAKLDNVEFDYAVGRMTNLIGAWYNQLIEVMGAMGIREARRLRGEVGRAMFFDQLEEQTFGKLFGTRKKS
jgi:hypothetical protein